MKLKVKNEGESAMLQARIKEKLRNISERVSNVKKIQQLMI